MKISRFSGIKTMNHLDYRTTNPDEVFFKDFPFGPIGQIGRINFEVPYESPILGQLLDLISLAEINLFEPRFKSYDPWDMANCLP